jgi:hypothetical protein
MPIKQTHIYRGHAIVHQVFASEVAEETIERFVVSQPGKQKHICAASTLDEAKAVVDERLAPAAARYAVNIV